MKPTATMTRWACGPARPVLLMTRLLLTLSALCAAQDNMAAENPRASKVGEFHEAAAMPSAMGMSDSRVAGTGQCLAPVQQQGQEDGDEWNGTFACVRQRYSNPTEGNRVCVVCHKEKCSRHCEGWHVLKSVLHSFLNIEIGMQQECPKAEILRIDTGSRVQDAKA